MIDSKPVDQALTFLLEHLPPQMHLVIATREDPQLPLARLRARGQLTELRAADLRFTPAEAAEFLNQVMGLNLSAEDIAAWKPAPKAGSPACNWPLSPCRGAQTPPVSSRLSPAATVLCWTIWSKKSCSASPNMCAASCCRPRFSTGFSGPLCDAVTGREDGREMLEALERGNLFVVPLDDQRQWYRYHHLFADVLQAHLTEAQPDQVSSAASAGKRVV